MSAPVLWVPLVALVPLQPPEAAQEVAMVEFHVRVEPAPRTTVVGFAVSVTVAAGTTFTVAVATSLWPSARLQVSEKDVLARREPVLSLPLVALVPFQPPEAVQEVALGEFHIRVDVAPTVTVDCVALRVVLSGGALLPGSTVEPHAATNRDATSGNTRISFL